MNLIAAVDKNWAIGYKGQLLVSIRSDQRNFRSRTENKVVILGRKTMDTFPGGRPLKNRRNIILTTNKNYSVPDGETANSIEEIMDMLKGYPSEDIYVIGGESVYRQFLPYCDRAYITKINYVYQADSYFPDLDKEAGWECISVSEEETYYDLDYRYCEYVRKPE